MLATGSSINCVGFARSYSSFFLYFFHGLLVSYILDGLKWGFRLGFSWSNPLNSTEKDNPSSRDAIDEYLQKEMRAGNLVGPISSRVFNKWTTSPCEPDRGGTKQWRIQGRAW